MDPDTQDVKPHDPTVFCDPNQTPVRIALESHPRPAEPESTFQQDDRVVSVHIRVWETLSRRGAGSRQRGR